MRAYLRGFSSGSRSRVISTVFILCGAGGYSSFAVKAHTDEFLRAQNKPLLFETVSIRPVIGNRPSAQDLTPDGFTMKNRTVWHLICIAYFEAALTSKPCIKNPPDWVLEDQLDVFAKLSPEDAAEWQRQTQMSDDSSVFKIAVQELLADRFGLRVHTVSADEDGFALVSARPGEKPVFASAEINPGDGEHPSSVSPETSIRLSKDLDHIEFHDQPLNELAKMLTRASGFIVEDRTGLSGKYTFSVLDRLPLHPNDSDREENRLPAQRWDLKPLGLKLVHARVHATTLVIDHIDRPSAN